MISSTFLFSRRCISTLRKLFKYPLQLDKREIPNALSNTRFAGRLQLECTQPSRGLMKSHSNPGLWHLEDYCSAPLLTNHGYQVMVIPTEGRVRAETCECCISRWSIVFCAKPMLSVPRDPSGAPSSVLIPLFNQRESCSAPHHGGPSHSRFALM
jgi:hypothetical protein